MHALHFPPRSPAIVNWELLALRRDEQRKRAAPAPKRRLGLLLIAEQRAWAAIKATGEPNDWWPGDPESPFFADIEAARAAAEG
jgi:hypothetical protein